MSEHEEHEESFELRRELILLGVGVLLLVAGIVAEPRIHGTPWVWLEYVIFGAAYLVAGGNVLLSAARGIVHGRIFDENFLMTVATLGAFAIHQLPEAVAVMVFYKVGEILQDLAVSRSRRSIDALLALRPDSARVRRDGAL
ncbi:MAG TPA: heavy metal translocating P-type ATPase, partial [Spirochaetia bacterium]